MRKSILQTLELMRQNPAGDWTLADIVKVAEAFGSQCSPPRGGGSHYRIVHSQLVAKLTIPYKRPVKPVYIRHFVAWIDVLRAEPWKQ